MLLDDLCHNTDPLHPEHWDKPTDTDQWAAKMAAPGCTLVLAPEQLWTPLLDAAMRNLAEWLSAVQHVGMADNNWHLFPVLAGFGLQLLGLPIDKALRDQNLARIQAFSQQDK
jgi:hypothetical protein